MTRPSFRFSLAEALALLGIAFGVWLIQYAFQPAADTPNLVVLWLSGLDIVLCFGLLSYSLRQSLRDGEALPKSWVVSSVVLTACFLGWISALLIDAERVRTEQGRLQDAEPQIVKLQDSLRPFTQGLPIADGVVERTAWQVNHDRFAQVLHQLQGALRTKPEWTKELTKIDDQVQQMQRLFVAVFADGAFDQRIKDRSDYLQAGNSAVQFAGALEADVHHRISELIVTHRVRWQAIGAAALTGVFLLLGCMTLWVVFDRELRRRGKTNSRLTVAEAHYRSLVEHLSDPVAVLDASLAIQYVNPAWQTAFSYRPDDLLGRNLFDLIQTEDRPRVQQALQTYDVLSTTRCRLAGDYGVMHDVDMQCQEHDDEKTAVVRFREVRPQTPAPKAAPQPVVVQPDPEAAQLRDKLKVAEDRLTELRTQTEQLRLSEQQARDELGHQRWLLGTHKEVATEGVLILSAEGQILSWNAAFVQMWKLSDETVSAHTWETIAAHMETQVHGGWDDFQRAVHPPTGAAADSCWEMNLEGGRVLEAYAQVLHDHPGRLGAIQFHFRDVTQNKALESQLRGHHEEKHQWDKTLREHEDHKSKHESTLREREKHLKHLEKKLRDHEDRFKELEATLREKDGHHQRLTGELAERDQHRETLEGAIRNHQDRLKAMEAALREKDDHHQRLTGQLAERDRHREELEADLRDHQERLHDLHESHERHADNLKAGKESMKRLANGIASDINKILSVVLGNADVLHESLPKDHLAQTYVDEIKQAANHGTELSQRLLAFSRNHLLQMVPVDLNRQLSALEPKIHEALGANVQLSWDYASQELWTKTDPHPLEQALLHVLTHARLHMPQGGR